MVNVELRATELIQQIGIPANLKGYNYTRTAIMLAVEDFTLIDRMTKGLYPAVAEVHNTTPTRVERAIRHSVDAAWERRALQNMFPHGKPINSELIATLADKIRLEVKGG